MDAKRQSGENEDIQFVHCSKFCVCVLPTIRTRRSARRLSADCRKVQGPAGFVVCTSGGRQFVHVCTLLVVVGNNSAKQICEDL